jgi:hypothetical protein
LLSNEFCEILEHIFELFLFILSILSILSTKQGSLSRDISLEKEFVFCWYVSAGSSGFAFGSGFFSLV